MTRKYKILHGKDYLRAIRHVRPFTKTEIQIQIILAAAESDGGLDEATVRDWSEEYRTTEYKHIIDASPDIQFMASYKETEPSTEFYELLQDSCQVDLSRLDSQEIPLCSNTIVSFLNEIGFRKAFKEIVVTGSVLKSIEKRGLPGRFSPFATPFDPVACIEYSGTIGESDCNPILFVNPLIMRKNNRDISFILKHEVLHYLQDHLHKLVLDDEEEQILYETMSWLPHDIVHLADELLREALVEDTLLASEDRVRSAATVDDMLIFYLEDPLEKPILTARLGRLASLDRELAKRFLNVETLYTLLSILGSYWISGKEIPPRAAAALDSLPEDYRVLYKEFSQYIPEITKDAFIDAKELREAVSLIIRHSQFFGDYLLYKAASS